ncbi:putative defensin-like protein 80 isoform X2 [Panicum virgatum]|uniref:putative defensin-like protein 80 isoform X2 n=1 Tax=Panicum virgatum TaxID=38727 RepID=UPI0019D5DF22|nr:putative defensin-like protein 80 isoform X2 [Panicum virgatum]
MTTMSAKFRSMAGKIVLVLVLGVLLHPFSSAGAGEEAMAALQPELPQCNPLVGPPDISPDCDTWCWYGGHPGGYVKGDVCCCNPGAGLADDADS